MSTAEMTAEREAEIREAVAGEHPDECRADVEEDRADLLAALDAARAEVTRVEAERSELHVRANNNAMSALVESGRASAAELARDAAVTRAERAEAALVRVAEAVHDAALAGHYGCEGSGPLTGEELAAIIAAARAR
jgi:hypothetical protein